MTRIQGMSTDLTHREFIPGTTGWSVRDLDDPEIEKLWAAGRYEIVEGVLTQMAAAYFDGGSALQELIHILRTYADSRHLHAKIATEVDIIRGAHRLPVADAVYLSADDQQKQKAAHAAEQRGRLKYGRILIPPTLVIESVSLGHEAHDRETKRGWYAEAGIPNFWILDAAKRSLDCLILDGATYRVDQTGTETSTLTPTLFPGLSIELSTLWAE